jgi:amino acid transporter
MPASWYLSSQLRTPVSLNSYEKLKQTDEVDLYIASRTLYGLAVEGNAPRIFKRTDARGVPIYALGLSSAFCLLAFLNVSTGSAIVFGYFVNLVTIFGLLTWISILVSHIFFVNARRAQDIHDGELAYKAPLGKWGSVGALFFCCLIAVFKGFPVFTYSPSHGNFDYKNFITNYLGIPMYLIMMFGYKVIMKSQRVRPETADMYGGKQRIDDEEAEFIAQQMKKNHGKVEGNWQRIYSRTIGVIF